MVSFLVGERGVQKRLPGVSGSGGVAILDPGGVRGWPRKVLSISLLISLLPFFIPLRGSVRSDPCWQRPLHRPCC